MYSELIDDNRNKAAISFCDTYQSGYMLQTSTCLFSERNWHKRTILFLKKTISLQLIINH